MSWMLLSRVAMRQRVGKESEEAPRRWCFGAASLMGAKRGSVQMLAIRVQFSGFIRHPSPGSFLLERDEHPALVYLLPKKTVPLEGRNLRIECFPSQFYTNAPGCHPKGALSLQRAAGTATNVLSHSHKFPPFPSRALTHGDEEYADKDKAKTLHN